MSDLSQPVPVPAPQKHANINRKSTKPWVWEWRTRTRGTGRLQAPRRILVREGRIEVSALGSYREHPSVRPPQLRVHKLIPPGSQAAVCCQAPTTDHDHGPKFLTTDRGLNIVCLCVREPLRTPVLTRKKQLSVMGVKMLQCFPFYRRCKERCKNRQGPPATVPTEETKPRLSSTTSWGSDSEGAGSFSRGSQIYFSTKARLSFRHQLDSNINAVDATY
ncbi:uncharacterized protein si:ch211-237l4.6 [Xiphias gladius]|uniref:uncharacterized protein si:ch211-237l4.6 n=1 Tax=Xiphias gladius TaxID=8245 RepID=UPI001A980464|nr:uncharacterized protein si:ch211-237l4.6 [Xiphias gladius]